MRGLPFPSSAVYERETSYEFGTPVDDIPIDPALAGAAPAIDPAIMGSEAVVPAEQPPLLPHPPLEETPRRRYQDSRQYEQGPQGDPFAPQPETFITVQPEEENPQPIPKPVRRKRRPRREEECGFCQGNDGKNKAGVTERMITCHECGRSGHPSCMELAEVGEVMASYEWNCQECKICEICHEKGDDERLLFCDFCDRGWHMDCVQPPIEEMPTGKWHCPMCPLIGPDGQLLQPIVSEVPPVEPEVLFEPIPPAPPSPSPARSPARGGKAAPTDDSEVDVGGPSATPKSRVRRKSRKSRAQQDAAATDSEEDVPRPLPTKRRRLRIHSPAPPSALAPERVILKVRLHPLKGKGKEREREDEDERQGLFDDLLSERDRSIARTGIDPADKARFDRSRLAAEEKLIPTPPPPPPAPAPAAPDPAGSPVAGPSTRPLRSAAQHAQAAAATPGRSMSPTRSTPVAPSKPPVQRIKSIRFGDFDIRTWYDAPFPEEYATIPDGRLWICEFCLKYMKSKFGAMRHRLKCKARHPPGDEIYRDGPVSIFEVDGRKNKIYCQNLCLLSKMFLDHKSLFYDVEPFLFYVMTETDDIGARFVGYFSKEKRSPKDYNVSCIMTLPVRQRQGWGNLLIDFSYLLSKKEQRTGSPEKPLSGLGAVSYQNYWTLAIMKYLRTVPPHPRLEDISAATSMTIEDICTVLHQQGFLLARERSPPHTRPRPSPGQSIRLPRGRRAGVARRNLTRTVTQDDGGGDTPARSTPFAPPARYDIKWDQEQVEGYVKAWEAKGYRALKPEKLKWSPFLVARTSKTEALGAASLNPGERESSVDDETRTREEEARVALALFADDNVDTPSSSGKPAISKRSLKGRKKAVNTQDQDPPATPTPSDAAQLEKDRALAEELAMTPMLPRRQLRSRSTPHGLDTPTPMSTRTQSLMKLPGRNGTDKTAAVAGDRDPLIPKRPVVTRRTRSDFARPQENGEPRRGEKAGGRNEEALALAVTENLPQRQLRSHTEATVALKRTNSKTQTPTSNPKPTSPRKRRRLDSSPEPTSPVPSAIEVEVQNGMASVDVDAHRKSSEPAAPIINRANGYAGESESPLTPYPALTDGHHVLTNGISVLTNHHRAQSEVKSEDAGTPLTGLTGVTSSRQSVPSDDTIAAVDVQGVKAAYADAADVQEVPPAVQIAEEEEEEEEEDPDAEGEVDPGDA